MSSWESTFVPYSGNAWDINTVRSAVDAFARRVSTAQPRHVRTDAETTVSVNGYLDRVLQFKPNPYMTASEFYYKLAAQYKIYNNAIAYPVYDESGKLAAIYPINAQYFELLEYMGVLYCRFRFATGSSYICEYNGQDNPDTLDATLIHQRGNLRLFRGIERNRREHSDPGARVRLL